eukprot:14604345-Ditylum_brightwellii.AAC.1
MQEKPLTQFASKRSQLKNQAVSKVELDRCGKLSSCYCFGGSSFTDGLLRKRYIWGEFSEEKERQGDYHQKRENTLLSNFLPIATQLLLLEKMHITA